MRQSLLALAAGVVAGILGHFVFMWMARRGFYALMLPGALVGIAAGYFRIRYVWVAIVCGLYALAIGLFSEWQFAPFLKDGSLHFFLTHVHELSPVTLLMIVVGALIGFGGPFGQYRREHAVTAATSQPPPNSTMEA